MKDDLRIESVRRDKLAVDVLDQIVALCTRAYEEDFSTIMKTFDSAVHVLAWFQSKLVSHALWVTRWLQAGDSPLLRTAFVEAVATEPYLQGRGFASAVMHRITKEVSDYQLGGLSPSDPSFYQRFGWELWRGPLFIRRNDDLLPSADDEEVMILRLSATPELDVTTPLSAEWRDGELW